MHELLAGVHTPLIYDILVLVVAGLLAGFVAGLFGVGGGTVTVPVLFHWFVHMGVNEDIAMHMAVGTSLATIISTSMASARTHHRKGAVDSDILYVWAPFIVIGSVCGVVLAAFLSGDVLRGVFGCFLLMIAMYMLCTREGQVFFTQLPSFWKQRAIATSIGTVSSLAGVGGGAIGVPVMSLFGVPMRSAVGTASAFGMLVAIPGTLGFILSGWHVPGLPPYTLGYVSLLGLCALLPTTAITAKIGAKVAHRVSRSFLRMIFSFFLTFVAVKMLWSLLIH